jgi:hypothetical protein
MTLCGPQAGQSIRNQLNQIFTALPDYPGHVFPLTLLRKNDSPASGEGRATSRRSPGRDSDAGGQLDRVARPVSDSLLERFVEVARQEQSLAVEQGAKSEMDPLWAAPAAAGPG